jgi:hypothetical protein
MLIVAGLTIAGHLLEVELQLTWVSLGHLIFGKRTAEGLRIVPVFIKGAEGFEVMAFREFLDGALVSIKPRASIFTLTRSPITRRRTSRSSGSSRSG